MRTIAIAATLLLAGLRAQEMPPPSPVPHLRELLRSEDPAVRLAAAESLGELGERKEEFLGLPVSAAVTGLLAAVAADPERRTAEMAALALAEIGPSALGALDHVEAQLDDWTKAGAPAAAVDSLRGMLRALDKCSRAAFVQQLVAVAHVAACAPGAVAGLAALGKDAAAAVPLLEEMLGSDVAELRWRAAFALAAIRGGGDVTLRARLDDKDGAVRFWALRALLTKGPDDATLRKSLHEWFAEPRPLVRRWALRAAAAMGGADAEDWPSIAAQLQSPIVESVEASRALMVLGPRAAPLVPTLIGIVDGNGDEWVRCTAIGILGTIGPAAAAAAKSLLPLAVTPARMPCEQDQVRFAAVTALGRIAPDLVIDALQARFEERPRDEENEEEAMQRHDYVSRLLLLGPAAARAVPALVRLLDENDRLAKLNALGQLEYLGRAAAPALPSILRELGSDDAAVRGSAIRVLTRLGDAGAKALPELERLFDHGDDQTRCDVVRDLDGLGAIAEPLLVRATRDRGDHWTRACAATALARLKAPSADAFAAVAKLLDDPDGVVRSEAVSALRSPAFAGRTHALFVQRLDSGDGFAESHYADSLGRELDPQIGVDLGTLIGAHRQSGRPAVELRALGERATALPWVLGFATASEPWVRAAVAGVLGRIGGTADDVEELRRLAADADANVRAAAVRSLGALGPRARAALPELAKAFRDAEWTVRSAAADALFAVQRD
jgi:HEAT repeat protein